MAFAILLIPFMLLFMVAVGAVLLRAAVSLANKVLGPQSAALPTPDFPIGPPGSTVPSPSAGAETANPFATDLNPASEQASTGAANPYAAPAVGSTNAIPSSTLVAQTRAIPEPSIGKAIGIVFLQGIATGATNFFIGQATQGQNIGAIISLALGFFISAGIYCGMLPTSFGRAALVYIFQILIGVVVACAIVGVVIGFSALIG